MKRITKFSIFNENVQQAKALLKRISVPETDKAYLRIRKALVNKDGYVGFFTKLHFEYGISINEVLDLINDLNDNEYLFSQLPKTLISYTNYEELRDDLSRTQEVIEAKKIYNEFPSEQKKFVDISKDLDILVSLYNREDKKNFLRKISSFHTRPELLKRLHGFLNSNPSSDFISVLSNIENSRPNPTIIYKSKEDNIIIIKITEYSQCRYLGSDTSWCIAGSEHTFKSYVPNSLTNQFIIYLLDRGAADTNRKIGVTYKISGYHTAHDIRDGYVSKNQLTAILAEYNYDINNLKVTKDSVTDMDDVSVKDLFNIGFTKDEVVSRKKKYTMNDYKLFTKEELLGYKMMTSNSSVKDLISLKFNKKDFVEYNILDINSTSVTNLLDLKFTLTDIAKSKKRFSKKDMTHFTDAMIKKYKLDEKTELNGSEIKNFSSIDIDEKGIFDRVIDGTMSIKDITHIMPRYIEKYKDTIIQKMSDKKTEGRNYNKDKELDSQRELFIKHFTKGRPKDSNKHDLAYHFQVGESYYNAFDLDATIYKLRYYNMGPDEFTLDELTHAFSKVNEKDFSKVYEFLVGSGFPLDTDEIIEFFKHIRYKSTLSSDNEIELYFTLLKLGIKCREQFLKYVNTMRRSDALYSTDLGMLNKTFTKDELEIFNNKEQNIKFQKDLSKCGKLASSPSYYSNKKDKITPEEFYKKWNTYIQTKDMPYGRYGDNQIAIIAIYSKLDKIDEIRNLTFDWKNREFVKNLCRYILGIFTYNNRQAVDISLDDNQKKKIYQKLISTNEYLITEQRENESRVEGYVLQVIWYVYDKDAFNDYLNLCSGVENNDYKMLYPKNSREGIKNYYTCRINNLEAILRYLSGKMGTKEKIDIKGVEKILKVVASWKMSKSEIEATHDKLVYFLYDYENYEKIVKELFPNPNYKKPSNDW